MSDMVKLPGGHGLDKKQTIALVAGIGLVGGYVLLKRRNSGGAATATDPAASVSDGSSDYSDPSLYSGDDSGLYPYGGSTAAAGGYYDPYSGQYIGTGVGGPIVTQVSTNPAWAQAAIAYLTQLGFNPITTATAIGKYLQGHSLTQSEEGIVQSAIAFEGQPPQPVPPPHVDPNPGHKPVKTIVANGHESLWQIAHKYGITENELIILNPHLGILFGTKKPVKKGTKVKV